MLNEIDSFNLPLFKLATKLEEIALNDDYFIKKKLYPNVDFYSGIILKALGSTESMLGIIFAVARTVGWISQWKEMTRYHPKETSKTRGSFMLEKFIENTSKLILEKNKL